MDRSFVQRLEAEEKVKYEKEKIEQKIKEEREFMAY